MTTVPEAQVTVRFISLTKTDDLPAILGDTDFISRRIAPQTRVGCITPEPDLVLCESRDQRCSDDDREKTPTRIRHRDATPTTATNRFLALSELAYYLIFGSFVVMTVKNEPDPSWVVDGALTPHLLQLSVATAGSLLLLVAPLEVLAVVAMPLIGLIHVAPHRQRWWRPIEPKA